MVPGAVADFGGSVEGAHRGLQQEGLARTAHAHGGLDPYFPIVASDRHGSLHRCDGAQRIVVLEVVAELPFVADLEADTVEAHYARADLACPLRRCGLRRR